MIIKWIILCDLLFLSCISSITTSLTSQDKLCYLSHGGSSETFIVNEALPIDTIIGSIQVIGNASHDGDIQLSISSQQQNSRWPTSEDEIPIRIAEGTKDLVLIRKLDKEGIEGEQSVIIGVKCQKKQTNDPSIIIPIRILITDANDNEPQWLGLPYVANLSEVTVLGSVVMQNIRAIDHDQQGPFSTVEYSIEPGPYSHLLHFSSPLEGTLILSSPLDFETLPKFWVTIRAQDQGDPPNSATTTVSINVIDADDQNPRFLDDKYSAALPDFQRAGDKLVISPRPIKAEDPDSGIRSAIIYSFNSESRENSYFTIDSKYGELSMHKPLPPAVNLPLTLVIRATQVDNRDRYALTTLTVLNRRQLVLPDTLQFIQSNYSASLVESNPPGYVLLTVRTTRSSSTSDKLLSANNNNNNNHNELQFQILDDDEKHFDIKNTGEIVLKKSLDYEKHKLYSFRVMVSNGKQSDVARVTVNVINVNEHDPLLSQNSYVFHVSESRLKSNSVIGEIHASDADEGDVVHFSLKGPHAQMFSISNEGHLKVKNLKWLNSTECHLIAISTDNGSPPRSASASVVVRFTPQVLKSFGRNVDLSGESGSGQGVDVNMLSHANFFNPTSSSAIILVIVLGVLLGTLFIIIIALTMHVLKHRKYTSSSSANSSSASSDSSTVTHHHNAYNDTSSQRNSSLTSLKLHHNNKIGIVPNGLAMGIGLDSSNVLISSTVGTRGVENPIFNMPNSASSLLRSTNNNNNITRLDPDSAVVSDASSNETLMSSSGHHSTDAIISRSNNNNINQNMSSIESCSPPPPPNLIGTASRISVIKWPQGSIPRRVKKLTWEDERRNRNLANHHNHNSDNNHPHHPSASSITIKSNNLHSTASNPTKHTELDPDVSVIPLRRTLLSNNAGLPDLTVYF